MTDLIHFCSYWFSWCDFPSFSFRSCDPNIFSLYNSGTVLPTARLTLENYKAILDFLLTAKKRKANLPSGIINMEITPRFLSTNVCTSPPSPPPYLTLHQRHTGAPVLLSMFLCSGFLFALFLKCSCFLWYHMNLEISV